MQSRSIPNNQPKPKGRFPIFSTLFAVLLLGTSAYIWLNYQGVLDWLNYQLYQPPSSVASIMTDAKMTERGKFAFYSSQPVVDGTRAFNAKCDRQEENSAILGCYTGNQIFIFDVTDERLEGIEEVTAVHEMLHAVYMRMSDSDRDRINKLLDVEADKLEKDKEFAERMDFYARTEPGERYNELHSIIGTEVPSISAELVTYYEQYFDRDTVLKLHQAYKSEFKKLETKAAQLKAELDALGKKIEQSKEDYAASIKKIDRDISDFNARADSGDFDSQAQFDAERQELVNRSNAIKAERSAINTMVARYNKLTKQHNDIITESAELYKSIDSTLAPAPSV